MKKKLISILLVIFMVLSLMPMAAFAANPIEMTIAKADISYAYAGEVYVILDDKDSTAQMIFDIIGDSLVSEKTYTWYDMIHDYTGIGDSNDFYAWTVVTDCTFTPTLDQDGNVVSIDASMTSETGDVYHITYTAAEPEYVTVTATDWSYDKEYYDVYVNSEDTKYLFELKEDLVYGKTYTYDDMNPSWTCTLNNSGYPDAYPTDATLTVTKDDVGLIHIGATMTLNGLIHQITYVPSSNKIDVNGTDLDGRYLSAYGFYLYTAKWGDYIVQLAFDVDEEKASYTNDDFVADYCIIYSDADQIPLVKVASDNVTVTNTETTKTLSGSFYAENGDEYIVNLTKNIAPAHTHNLVEVTGQAATCTAAGVRTYWSCSCGKYFEDAAAVKEISDIDVWRSVGGAGYLPAGHSIGEWISEVPATCTEEGVKAHADCTVCGKHFDADGNVIDDLSISALGHKPVFTYNSTSTGLTITCANEGCDLSSSVLVTAEDAVYSGNPVAGSFTADDDFASLIGADQLVLSYMDENGFISGAPTDAGFYRACISFVYDGITYTPSARFDILAAPIAVTFGDDTEFVFDGTQHTPSYEVKDSEGIVLVKGKDYAIDRTWKDTAGADARPQAGYCAGNGTLIVKGIGNYTGSFSVEYSVDKAPLSVEGIEEKYDYTGEDVIAAGDYRVLDVYGRDLEEGKDFTVVIDDGQNEIREPGKHTIKFVSLNPNYDSVEFSFTIKNNGSPKTGYSSNMMLYLAMIIAALTAAVVSTVIMRRKKAR